MRIYIQVQCKLDGGSLLACDQKVDMDRYEIELDRASLPCITHLLQHRGALALLAQSDLCAQLVLLQYEHRRKAEIDFNIYGCEQV